MDKRSMMEGHLEQALRHVALGKEHLASQRNVVDRLEEQGHDSTEARRLLSEFEEMKRSHDYDMLRLEKELQELQ